MTTKSLSGHEAMAVKHNARAIVQLPQPGSQWRHRDLEAHLQPRLKAFNSNGIIQRIEKIKHDGEIFSVWETERDAYKAAKRQLERAPDEKTLPCGHALAFQNRGGRIHCKHPGCGGDWPVDTIRPIIQGGGGR